MDPDHVGADLAKVLLSESDIQHRLGEVAAEIEHDYEGRDLLLVGVLKGAVVVMADLSRHFRRMWRPTGWRSRPMARERSPVAWSASSRTSTPILTGRNVIIVEDIIDTGLTVVLAGRQPPFTRSGLSGDLRLLRKREAAKTPVGVRYVGFDIPNEFVVGYGLDFAERYRNLRVVATLAPHMYS